MALKRGGLVLLLALAALAAGSGGQAASAVVPLDYGCAADPPAPPSSPTAAACAGWLVRPATLYWFYDNQVYKPTGGTDSCLPHDFVADTTGTQISCQVTRIANPAEVVSVAYTAKLDATPPTIAGAAPDRQPDYNGWWNHPVTFTFSGSDATSGLASCDTITYSGPDTASGTVTGGCKDVAGNAASVAVPIKYDATPPALSNVSAVPGDASASISWNPGPDVVRTEVSRTPGDSLGAPSRRVFDGGTAGYKDVGLVNGVSYTYNVTAFDQANNSASASTTVVPAAPPSPTGKLAGKNIFTKTPPLLQWRRIKGARYYNLQLFRGTHKVLSAWPVSAKMKLRVKWHFRGHRYRLTRGRYHWYVWPGYGPRTARRYGSLVHKGTFYFRP